MERHTDNGESELMSTIRALILRAPGTNCDEETAWAFDDAGAKSDRVHVNRLIDEPALLEGYQILCLPGGFSFGDDLGSGRILSLIMKDRLGNELNAFRDRGGLILGICNGFQVLLQTGLLIDRDPLTGKIPATLAPNRQGRYEDRWVHLAFKGGKCAFVKDDEILTLPIAHAEGRFLADSNQRLEEWTRSGRIVARYVDERGNPGDFPINPNGSKEAVAGICDETGRVFGLMPHPERHLFATQHPSWTRRSEQPVEGDGRRIFRNAVLYLKA